MRVHLTLNQIAKAMNALALKANREFTMQQVRLAKNAIQNGDFNLLPAGLLEELNFSKSALSTNVKTNFNGKNAAKCLKFWCVEKRGRTVSIIKHTGYKRWMFDKWFMGQAVSEDVWGRLLIAIKHIEASEFDRTFDDCWGAET